MFTGIVEATAAILQKTDHLLTVERPGTFTDLKIGSSVAVSGVCLTIVDLEKKSMTFDVVEETLEKSKLGSLSIGDRVNLERAMRADGRFDGHVVQGHCEGVGRVVALTTAILTISIPSALLPFIIPKGSVCIDGVSLTVADIQKETIAVALVPHTLRETTLGLLKTGDHVNLETDILVRAVLSQKRVVS